MQLQYVLDHANNESFVELKASLNDEAFALLVVQDKTGRAEMQFAVDGRIVKVELSEFEEGFKKAKEMLGLTK